MLHERITFKTFFLFVLITLSSLLSLHAGTSQSLPTLSDKALVSVVTCSATSDYEGGFGHSSLRIQDAPLGIDVAFNFGSYTKDQSFFAYRVFLGTIVSFLDGEPFKIFADRYKKDGRGINEYYLNLDQHQKQRLWEELNRILISGDRFYSFKFPTDNCSTQLRDLLFKQCNWDATPYKNQSSKQSFRDIENADPLENCWLDLFFNLIAGPQGDKEISIYQKAFNPDGLFFLLKEVNNNGKPLILASHKIFAPTTFKEKPNQLIPIVLFSLLLLTAAILTYRQFSKHSKPCIWFDRAILFLSGIFGCFIGSLLLFSHIESMQSNYNIMWALPTNLILAFLLRKNSTALWLKIWIGITCLSILLFPIISAICGQVIQPEAYLFACTLAFRLLSYYRLRK